LFVHALRTSTPFHALRPTQLVRHGEAALHYSFIIASEYLAANFGDIDEKMFGTDFCNRLTIRAPADRSIPERSAFAELVASGAE
jgi:hypothetical protein